MDRQDVDCPEGYFWPNSGSGGRETTIQPKLIIVINAASLFCEITSLYEMQLQEAESKFIENSRKIMRT